MRVLVRLAVMGAGACLCEPALALPEITFEDDFIIPFSYTFSRSISLGIGQPFDITFEQAVPAFLPGFSSMDSRLGALVGLPVAKEYNYNFSGTTSARYFFFGNCSTASLCPERSVSTAATFRIGNEAVGLSTSGQAVRFIESTALPPAQFEDASYALSNGGIIRYGQDASQTGVAPGDYRFDASLRLFANGLTRFQYSSVSGSVTGNLSGTVFTTVETAKLGSNREALTSISQSLEKVSVGLSGLAYGTGDLPQTADAWIDGTLKREAALRFLWSTANLAADLGIIKLNDTGEQLRAYTDAAIRTADLVNAIADAATGSPAKKAEAVKTLAALDIAAASSTLSFISGVLEIVANDPPDSKFNELLDTRLRLLAAVSSYERILADPDFASISVETQLARLSTLQTANLLGALVAYERYQGALLAGDYDAASAQLQLAQSFSADAQRVGGDLSTSLQSVISKSGSKASIEQFDIAERSLNSFLNEVLAEGISADQLLGYTIFDNVDQFRLAYNDGLVRLRTFVAQESLSGDPSLLAALADQGTYAVTLPGSSNVPPVPEPATWVTMLIGFGAVGYTVRRRKAGLRLRQAV